MAMEHPPFETNRLPGDLASYQHSAAGSGVVSSASVAFSSVIHVEVCQNPCRSAIVAGNHDSVSESSLLPCSTLAPSVVRDHTKALLKKQGAVFGDFIVTDFDNLLLREHVISISVSDIPKELRVFCLPHAISYDL